MYYDQMHSISITAITILEQAGSISLALQAATNPITDIHVGKRRQYEF